MTAGAGFPLDILIFGVVAVLLVFRLRGILGKRDGFEPKSAVPPVAAAAAEPPAVQPTPVPAGVPEPGTHLAQALWAIQAAEPSFDPARFLNDAQSAFRAIVLAFARGDRPTLALLTGREPYAAFEQAIAEREQAALTQHAEILAIESAEITDATLAGRIATITVAFVSEQTSYTTNAAGEIIAGHEGRTLIDDIWSFERTLGAPDPVWKLVATHTR
jgi:predicted lipid-binding transport protein (Tim44 family)